MITKVLLDVDGVLNDMIIKAFQYVGCDIDHVSQYKVEWGYDMVNGCREMRPEIEWTQQEFWTRIDRAFWRDIPRSEECSMIIRKSVELVGEKNVSLLTSPTLDPDCVAGKVEWIQQNLPKFLHRQFLIGPCKHFCAHPHHLLVDDSDDKVRKFKEHGGKAILVPRPWNSNHDLDTFLWVSSRFGDLLSRQ